jgi:hypothetical protein
LIRLSDWDRNSLEQDVSREGFNDSDIGEVAVWLARRGRPDIRRRMAEALVPVILNGLERFARDYLLPAAFSHDVDRRKERSARISKTKQSGRITARRNNGKA